jgi:hypothetical protein
MKVIFVIFFSLFFQNNATIRELIIDTIRPEIESEYNVNQGGNIDGLV